MGKIFHVISGLPRCSEVKNPSANAGDAGFIPGSWRSPGEANGNLLQYSCLRNPIDGGSWWGTVHRVSKCGTQLRDWNNNYVISLKNSVWCVSFCTSGSCGDGHFFHLFDISGCPYHGRWGLCRESRGKQVSAHLHSDACGVKGVGRRLNLIIRKNQAYIS